MQKKLFRERTVKVLHGGDQTQEYQILHLIDPEDSGILCFEETGEGHSSRLIQRRSR